MGYIKKLGLPRLIIIGFFLLLWVLAATQKLNVSLLLKDSLTRIGMNMIMVLAMVPSIRSGIGLNFALPIGIVCGIFGGILAIEFEVKGIIGLFYSTAIAVPMAIVVGWVYGIMLNKIKGSEMLVSTYVGFSFVSVLCILWSVFPTNSNEMRWPIGDGLRTVVALENTYEKVLDKIFSFDMGNIIPGLEGFIVPTGLLIVVAIICFIYFVFSNTKTGVAMKTVGDNPKFATAIGLNVDKYRILGTILSTVLGAVGMIIFAQSFGYIQLYSAPLMMAFPAVAAILIGGATAKKANISFVIIGTILFQGLLTISLPVASSFFSGGNISEVIRMIVQNGIILYALAQGGND